MRRRAATPLRLLLLAGLIATVAAPAGAAGAADGTLTVEVEPAKLARGAGSVVVRVANQGATAVTAVALTVEAPPGVTAALDPVDATIGAGGSVLTRLNVDGPPVVVVVKATGRSGTVPVAAFAAVELSAATSHTLALVGNTKLADRSPADLHVVFTNTSDATVHVDLSADASRHRAVLQKTSLDVPAGAVDDVALTVSADGALRRGTVGVVVRADVPGGQPQHLVASRELAVSLASDELPGPLGVGSVVVIPGLVALLAFFEVRSQDRRRIGAAHLGAKVVWDNKTWLLLAGGLSLVAATAYAAVTGRDVLDAYELSDIAVLTVVLGGAGAGVGLATVLAHRRSVPAITGQSSPADVLKAAQRTSNSLDRKTYKTDGDRVGLLVQQDGGSLVLTPPIVFESGDDFWDAWNDTADPDRFGKVVARLTSAFDGRFAPEPGGVAGPTVVDQAVEVGHRQLLDYAG